MTQSRSQNKITKIYYYVGKDRAKDYLELAYDCQFRGGSFFYSDYHALEAAIIETDSLAVGEKGLVLEYVISEDKQQKVYEAYCETKDSNGAFCASPTISTKEIMDFNHFVGYTEFWLIPNQEIYKVYHQHVRCDPFLKKIYLENIQLKQFCVEFNKANMDHQSKVMIYGLMILTSIFSTGISVQYASWPTTGLLMLAEVLCLTYFNDRVVTPRKEKQDVLRSAINSLAKQTIFTKFDSENLIDTGKALTDFLVPAHKLK